MARPSQNGASVNKSEAIRELLRQNPRLKTKEVVAQLAERNIKVTPHLVYFNKGRLKRETRQYRRERVTETAHRVGHVNPAHLVMRVKELARDAGGIRVLKQLVDALAE